MNFKELQKVVDIVMGKDLMAAGFQWISAGTWSRNCGDELNVVQLQKHSTKEEFCVNLGVYYAFLPKSGIEAPLDSRNIELLDCELKFRLTDQDIIKDQWWPIIQSSVDEIVEIMNRRGFQVFDLFRLDGPIAKINVESIENGDYGLLSSLTNVRACLLLARIHQYLGNRDACIQFAQMGIRAAGRAVGPRKALMDILKFGG